MKRNRAQADHRPLILHIVHRFDVGGLENGIVNLINRLPAARWRHGIVALDEVSESYLARVQRADIFHLSLRKPPGHALRLYPRLYRLFRELRPAIVHTRNLAALEASVPAWAAGVPVRIHGEHGWDVNDPNGSSPKYRIIRKLYRPFVQHYVAMSKDIEKYLEQRVAIDKHFVSQIYNGVDTVRFKPALNGRQAPADCPFQAEDLWLIGTVGRMQAIKDQANLAEAFVLALQRNPGAAKRLRIVMVGDGPLRHNLEAILSRDGLRHLAWFPGERSDIPEIMRALDCFVLPSLSEGISNTILEAMASGCPVVATRVGGNPELIEDQCTGRLVSPGNSLALSEAILSYFNQPNEARRHGEAARRVVERRFSLDRMVDDYEQLYLELMDKHPSPEARLHGS
jgi:sugar transferase (PEP-CTERM/EpsH1 system associated)